MDNYVSTEMTLLEVDESNKILSKECVIRSLNSFINKPVTQNGVVVGVISGVKMIDSKVIGTVIWFKDKAIASEYDNWNLTPLNNEDTFEILNIEV